MIVEYIRYALTGHTPAELTVAYSAAAPHLEAAPECHGFDLAQCMEDANAFVPRIRWASAAAHLTSFRTGLNFPPFLAAIRPFIADIAEMRHYDTTPHHTNSMGEGLMTLIRQAT